jgi:hypothetical protein
MNLSNEKHVPFTQWFLVCPCYVDSETRWVYKCMSGYDVIQKHCKKAGEEAVIGSANRLDVPILSPACLATLCKM